MHAVLSDPLVRGFCLDCVYPLDEKGQTTWPTTTINYNTFRLKLPRPNNYLPNSQ